jgi:hypothetical protein
MPVPCRADVSAARTGLRLLRVRRCATPLWTPAQITSIVRNEKYLKDVSVVESTYPYHPGSTVVCDNNRTTFVGGQQ